MSKTTYFAKSTVFSYLSNAVIMLSAFVYTYFAANILGPESYGLIIYLMTFMASLPGIFGFETISDTLSVYTAKLRNRKLATNLFLGTFSILAVLSLIVYLFPEYVFFFLDKGTIDLVKLTAIFIFLSPITVFFGSVFIGFKKFGKILYLTIIEKMSDLIFLYVFLLVLDLGIYSLIYAKIVTIFIASFCYFLFFRNLKFEDKKIDKKEIIQYGSTSFLANTTKAFANQIEILVIGILLFGPFLGIFLLLKKMVTYLYEFPQLAISNVLLPFLSEKSESKENLVLYTSLVMKFQIISNFLISLFFIFVTPFVILWFFPAYVYGIQIIPLLAIGLLFSFMSPLIRLLKSINKNNYITLGQVVFGISFVILAYSLIPIYGIYGAAIAYAFSRLFFTGVLYLFVRHLGYSVSFIPTKKDLKFFWTHLIIFLKAGFLKLKKFKL